MENLAKAIENRKNSLVLASLSSRDLQCVVSNPSNSLYFDENSVLHGFYQNLNRYFLTHNIVCLNECYRHYFELENQGWVIENSRFKNLLFQRFIDKIELTVEAWFYRYAMSLDFDWLNSALEVLIEAELRDFKNLRQRASVSPTSFESFKKQVDYFPEMRLKYYTERKLQEYLRFTVFKLSLDTWDYRKPVIFDGIEMYSTEINVPALEVDLNEVVYFKVQQLGLIWANRYITEPTARNTFIRLNGLAS